MESTTAVSNEIFQNTVEELRTLEKKNLKINRIRLILSVLAVALCIVIACVLLVHMIHITENIEEISTVMTEAGENINVVATDLQKIDFGTLAESAQTFAQVGTETTQQIKEATSGLDTILNDADIALKNLSSINIDQLNAGIQELHDVLEPLAKLVNVFH